MVKSETPTTPCTRCGHALSRTDETTCRDRQACAQRLLAAHSLDSESPCAVVILDGALLRPPRPLALSDDPRPDDFDSPEFLTCDELTQRFGWPVVAVYAEASNGGSGARPGVHAVHEPRIREILGNLRGMFPGAPTKTRAELGPWAAEQIAAIRAQLEVVETAVREIDDNEPIAIWGEVSNLAETVTLFADQVGDLELSQE